MNRFLLTALVTLSLSACDSLPAPDTLDGVSDEEFRHDVESEPYDPLEEYDPSLQPEEYDTEPPLPPSPDDDALGMVGTCLNYDDSGEGIEDVVPCEQNHDAQVVGAPELIADCPPGTDKEFESADPGQTRKLCLDEDE